MADRDQKDHARDRDDEPSTPGGEAAQVQAELAELGLFSTPRIRVLRGVGEGGVGRVEAVTDEALGRTAAKKTLHEESQADAGRVRRFVREARITSQLDHPSVVPVHDIGLDGEGRLYFTLKLVEGRTLADMIDGWRDDGVDAATLLDVLDALVKVCDALSLAHSRGVVHCDVKPDNIMVGDYGETYLMDWGAALVLPEAAARRRPASLPGLGAERPSLPGDTWDDDTISGTPGYMAPEQASAEVDLIGPRTDVFGLGATLYEVITGHSPYASTPAEATIDLAAAGRYPPLEELVEQDTIPPLLQDVIEQAMAPEPDDRFASVEQLKSELVRYLRGGGSFPVTHFEAGTVVVRQGEAGDSAFIITRGHCEVFKEVDGERVVIRRLGPGELFGETALLSPGPRTATVVTLEPVSAQVIWRDAMTSEVESIRPWLGQLIRTVVARFREADAQRHAALAQPPPLELARPATMYLHTWGRAEPDGTLVAPWSALARATVGDDVPGRAERLHAALASYEQFRVDRDRDVVALEDPAGFADRLAREPAR